jgi:hypothetical protein
MKDGDKKTFLGFSPKGKKVFKTNRRGLIFIDELH